MGKIKDKKAYLNPNGGHPTSIIDALNSETNFNFSHSFTKDEQIGILKKISRITDESARELLMEIYGTAESLKSRCENGATIARKVAASLIALDEDLFPPPTPEEG